MEENNQSYPKLSSISFDMFPVLSSFLIFSSTRSTRQRWKSMLNSVDYVTSCVQKLHFLSWYLTIVLNIAYDKAFQSKVPPPLDLHLDRDHGQHLHIDGIILPIWSYYDDDMINIIMMILWSLKGDPSHLVGQIHHNRSPKGRTTAAWAPSVRELWGGGETFVICPYHYVGNLFRWSEQYDLDNPYKYMQVTILDKPDAKDVVDTIETVSSWKWMMLSSAEPTQSPPPPSQPPQNFNRPCSVCTFELGSTGAPRQAP